MYLELVGSNPYPNTLFLQDPFKKYTPFILATHLLTYITLALISLYNIYSI
jgi:hypothetical protein